MFSEKPPPLIMKRFSPRFSGVKLHRQLMTNIMERKQQQLRNIRHFIAHDLATMQQETGQMRVCVTAHSADLKQMLWNELNLCDFVTDITDGDGPLDVRFCLHRPRNKRGSGIQNWAIGAMDGQTAVPWIAQIETPNKAKEKTTEFVCL